MLVSKSLLSVASIASKDSTRPVLNAIRIYKEDGKIVSVATDGYVLGEVIEEVPNASEFPLDHEMTDPDSVMLPAATAKKLSKSIGKVKYIPVLGFGMVENDKATATDLEETTTLSFKQPEGNYPEYRKLMEDHASADYTSLLINPNYLKKVLEIFKDCGSVELCLPVNNKFKPVILREQTGESKKTAVVMPLKG